MGFGTLPSTGTIVLHILKQFVKRVKERLCFLSSFSKLIPPYVFCYLAHQLGENLEAYTLTRCCGSDSVKIKLHFLIWSKNI